MNMKHWMLGALILGSSQAWAIHKCKAPDGSTVFQDVACASQGEVIAVNPASGRADPAAAQAARQRVQSPRSGQTAQPTASKLRSPRAPTHAGRCPTAQEIRNMEVSANSITLDKSEKLLRLRQIGEARKCR
jgi:hypothetical protein